MLFLKGRGCLELEDLNINILRGFKIRARNIAKDKAGYLCNTETGVKAIRKSLCDQKSLLFQHVTKTHLHQNGFQSIDMFYMSSQDTPFFEYGGETFVMTDLMGGRVLDFSCDEDFAKALEALAKVHKLSKGHEGAGRL